MGLEDAHELTAAQRHLFDKHWQQRAEYHASRAPVRIHTRTWEGSMETVAPTLHKQHYVAYHEGKRCVDLGPDSITLFDHAKHIPFATPDEILHQPVVAFGFRLSDDLKKFIRLDDYELPDRASGQTDCQYQTGQESLLPVVQGDVAEIVGRINRYVRELTSTRGRRVGRSRNEPEHVDVLIQRLVQMRNALVERAPGR